MEYGLIPRINQYVDNSLLRTEQIQATNKITPLKNGDESAVIKSGTFLKGVDGKSTEKVSQTKEVSGQNTEEYQEVELTNLNFGYNNSSHDFYVKAIRGEAQNQYPTDEMMKLKAYFISETKV